MYGLFIACIIWGVLTLLMVVFCRLQDYYDDRKLQRHIKELNEQINATRGFKYIIFREAIIPVLEEEYDHYHLAGEIFCGAIIIPVLEEEYDHYHLAGEIFCGAIIDKDTQLHRHPKYPLIGYVGELPVINIEEQLFELEL